MHPDDPALVIYGGQGNSSTSNWSFGLARSTNGGGAWQRTFINQSVRGYCYTLAVAPSGTDTVYAGGYVNAAGAVARSIDRGASWTQVGAPPDTVFCLIADPAVAARAFAATAGGVYRTTDAGATWQRLLDRRGMRAIRLHPDDADEVCAGGDEGVWQSTDAGATWLEMNDGLETPAVWCLEFADAAPDLRLLAGTTGGAAWCWSWPTGVENRAEGGGMSVEPRCPTVLCAPDLAMLDARVLDIQGRDVTAGRQALAPGVYFIQAGSGGHQAAGGFPPGVRRVVMTR